MTVSVARYYQREKITLDCTILTPMFLGDADQQAALSTAPIKAALRYWWRVSGVHKAKDAEKLFEEESKNLFESHLILFNIKQIIAT